MDMIERISDAHIEEHFDLLSSRREVNRVEIDQGISITETEFDAAVMLDVERATKRTNERREYRGMR